MSTTVLYTPDVLVLATSLAAYPLDESFVDVADARSPACGSTITLGLLFDADGAIAAVGLRSRACAIGQASAALFANAAVGRSAAGVRGTARAIADWLRGDGDLPDWPGFDAIAAARAYPARHGALMLPWNAALQLLPSD